MADEITIKTSSPQSTGQAQSPTQASSSKAFNLAAEVDATTPTSPSIADKYITPALVKEKFPDLVELIKTTESMSDDEREYWFQILPIMTEDQISKLRDILMNEKSQLSKLDKEYEDELNRLNDKHMLEWKEFESKEKRRALTTAEQQSEAQEKNAEEDLLAKLSQI